MGLLDNLRNKARGARDKPGIKSNVNQAEVQAVARSYTDWTMSNSEAIYSAINRISSSVSTIPIHLYQNYHIAKDHPLERLMAYAPNEYMTPGTYKRTMEAIRNSEGTAYALIVPSEKKLDPFPQALDVLDPRKVTPFREKKSREIWYEIDMDGKTVFVHHSSMIVLNHISSNGIKGIRPLDVLKGTIDYNQRTKEYSLQQLEGIRSGMILNVPNTIQNKEKKDEMIRSFLDTYKESKGSVVLLDGGLTATPINSSPIDAKILDVERVSKGQVAAVYNIPPHMLGDFSNQKYTSPEHGMMEFQTFTIAPIMTQWEEEHNQKLLTPDMVFKEGLSFRADMSALLRGDTAAMSNRNQQAIRGGWAKVNEVRAGEFKPPVEGGDTLFISKDLVPMEMLLRLYENGKAGELDE